MAGIRLGYRQPYVNEYSLDSEKEPGMIVSDYKDTGRKEMVPYHCILSSKHG